MRTGAGKADASLRQLAKIHCDFCNYDDLMNAMRCKPLYGADAGGRFACGPLIYLKADT
jgi:hypothetical protein